MYDVCIIGGGAAGMAAAISVASDKKTILIEKNKKLGRKIYSTGNGKCNITNKYIDLYKHYHSSDDEYADFMKACIGDEPYASMYSFITKLGVSLYDNDGYVYPLSNQASSIVWAMQDRIKENNIEIRLKTTVDRIDYKDNIYFIHTDTDLIKAKNIILACGGASYKALGGDYIGYAISKSLGHSIIDVKQALCGLSTKEKTEAIAGVRVKARGILIDDEGNKYFEEAGELQITEYGLSGIMIFNMSSTIARLLDKGIRTSISFDIIGNMEYEEYIKIYNHSKKRSLMGFLNGIINDKLAEYIISRLKLDGKSNLEFVDMKDIDRLFYIMKNLIFKVDKLNDVDKGQVCSGGVAIKEVNPQTMESTILKNMYLCGEMLDIDGACGGYNLTFAIMSGIKAGKNI